MKAGPTHSHFRGMLAERIAVHRAPRKPPGKGLWAALGPGLIVALLLIANIMNLGADLGAMGDALTRLVGGSAHAM